MNGHFVVFESGFDIAPPLGINTPRVVENHFGTVAMVLSDGRCESRRKPDHKAIRANYGQQRLGCR
jgi:hypothetical protein